MTTPTTTQKSSLTARAAWLLSAKVVAFALSFALPLLLVRRLSQPEFGVYKQVFLVINTAITVLPFGFAMSAFYFLPRETEKSRRGQIIFNIFLFNFAVGALALILLLVHPAALGWLVTSGELTGLSVSVGIVIFLWIVSSFLEFAAVANQEVKTATAFIVFSQLSKTILMLAAATIFGTVESLIYATMVQCALQSALLIYYLRSRFGKFWRGFDRSVLRAQLAYAVPLGFATMLYSLQTDLHSYFVSNRFDDATFAIYAIGCFQLPLFALLGEAAAGALLPRISELQKQNERHTILLLTVGAMRKLAAVTLPLYALLMIVAHELITFMFTARYSESAWLFMINLSLVPFSILLHDPVMRAYAEQRYFLIKMRLIVLALLVIALIVGINFFGLMGAVSAVVVVGVIERIAVTQRLARILEFTRKDLPLLKDVGKIMIATLGASVVTIIARLFVVGLKPFYVLAVCGCVFAVAYLLFVLPLKVLTADEWNSLSEQFMKVARRVRPRLNATDATSHSAAATLPDALLNRRDVDESVNPKSRLA